MRNNIKLYLKKIISCLLWKIFSAIDTIYINRTTLNMNFIYVISCIIMSLFFKTDRFTLSIWTVDISKETS